MPKSDYTPEQLAERTRKAYADYDLLQSGYKPNAADLANAPLLSDWLVSVHPCGETQLIGHVTGHPSLGPGLITTSAVLVMDVGAGWARTFGRYYRLGPAAQPTKIQANESLAETFPVEDGDDNDGGGMHL